MRLASKIRLILGGCLLLVLFSSCRPHGVLSRKEMASVLFDMHLTEAAVNDIYGPIPEEWTHGLKNEYFKDLAYRSVLKKHHLTQEEFYFSVAWYSQHMNQYLKVYMDVQKQMDTFIADIDRGQFDKSVDPVKIGLDTVKSRALYTFGLMRVDTLRARPSYLRADQQSTHSMWQARQWLYSLPKDTTRLNLFPQLSIHSLFNTSNPDSLKAIADSLIKQQPASEPLAPKEILAPGARHLPTRNFREVSKGEQIRRRFQQRALENERNNVQDPEAERRRKIEASRQVEPNHWKN